jgi:hypothetical protein
MSLQNEFQWYLEHQNELVEKYEGKFIVIKNQQVIGVYDTDEDAYVKSSETNELGTFLIQECLPGEDSYTQVFHSRVIYQYA